MNIISCLHLLFLFMFSFNYASDERYVFDQEAIGTSGEHKNIKLFENILLQQSANPVYESRALHNLLRDETICNQVKAEIECCINERIDAMKCICIGLSVEDTLIPKQVSKKKGIFSKPSVQYCNVDIERPFNVNDPIPDQNSMPDEMTYNKSLYENS